MIPTNRFLFGSSTRAPETPSLEARHRGHRPSPLMGRRALTAPVDKYFDDRSLVAASKSGLITESSCKCCDAPPFMALTSTRKVAHICGIPGQGILACSHSVIKLTAAQVGDVASTTKSGREWLERGAGGPSPHLENTPALASNPTAGATPSCFFVHVCLQVHRLALRFLRDRLVCWRHSTLVDA